jgi:hypothetical protein
VIWLVSSLFWVYFGSDIEKRTQPACRSWRVKLETDKQKMYVQITLIRIIKNNQTDNDLLNLQKANIFCFLIQKKK